MSVSLRAARARGEQDVKDANALAPELLTELIQMGRRGVPVVPPFFADPNLTFTAIVCGDGPWQVVGQDLPKAELADLIKGLVLLSRAHGCSLGGSVSPVIALVRCYVNRFPQRHDVLTGWIVDHSLNQAEPWGRCALHAARSRDECVEIERQEESQRAARESRRDEDARLNRIKTAADATTKLASAVRRGDLKAVQALLAHGAAAESALPGGGSLVALAREYHRDAVAEFLEARGSR